MDLFQGIQIGPETHHTLFIKCFPNTPPYVAPANDSSISLRSPSLPFFIHLLFTIMNIPQVYAIAAGGVFVLLLIMKSGSSIHHVFHALTILVAKHLTYPFLVRHHRLLRPWSRADVLLQVTYFTINIFCMTFRVVSVKDAETRAGTLAMINLTPLFSGFHLSFSGDNLRIFLTDFRRIHRIMKWMSLLLGVVHALVVIHGDPSFLRDMLKNLYAVIVSR